MKIIKRGTLVEEWTLNVDCKNCDSELEIDETDLSRESYTAGDQRDTYTAYRYVINCPVCHTRIRICEKKSRQLPDGSQMPLVVAQAVDRRSGGGGVTAWRDR